MHPSVSFHKGFKETVGASAYTYVRGKSESGVQSKYPFFNPLYVIKG